MPRLQFREKLRNARKVNRASEPLNQIFGKPYKILKNYSRGGAAAQREELYESRQRIAPLRRCVRNFLSGGYHRCKLTGEHQTERAHQACVVAERRGKDGRQRQTTANRMCRERAAQLARDQRPSARNVP